MMWKGKRVLLTGAGGFIGSHLAEALVGRGARLRAFLRYNSRSDIGQLRFVSRSLRDEMELIVGDLKDPGTIRAIVRGQEVIFHLGALIAIPYSYQSPLDFVQTNVDGTANLLVAAQEQGVERFVHTSTSEVYGTAQYVPMDEQHPLRAQSPYAATKIAADQLALSFHRAHGLPVTVVRPFNCFGPRQSARAIVPTIITQTLTSGEVYLGTLGARRDLTYVLDTAEAFIRAAEVPDTVGAVMNVGSGRDISIDELAQTVFSLAGKHPRVVTDPARVRPAGSEVERLQADSSVAKQLMGWEARTTLKDGLSRTMAWISDHLDIYRPGEYVI